MPHHGHHTLDARLARRVHHPADKRLAHVLFLVVQGAAQRFLAALAQKSLLHAEQRRLSFVVEILLHFFKQVVLALLFQHTHHLVAHRFAHVPDGAAAQKTGRP